MNITAMTNPFGGARPVVVGGAAGDMAASAVGLALTLAVWGFAFYGVYKFATRRKRAR